MSFSVPRPGRPSRRHRDEPTAGIPPEQHPFWARLESPLSTYYLLVAVVGALLLIGLVMVLSASSVASLRSNDSSYTLFLKQAEFAVLGVVGAVLMALLPRHLWRRVGIPLLLFALMLQMLVFTPLGITVMGNRNWLRLGPVQIQPSEIGKVALIVYAAGVLAAKRRLLHRWRHVLVPVVAPSGILVIGLVIKGHDLGTAMVIMSILAAMLWAAGVSSKLFLVGGAAVGAVLAVAVAVSGNRMQRLGQWMNCSDVQQCWQSQHGRFALADGGLSGLGLGASREKWSWLPEPHNDFIFAIIGEELGIGGTLAVIALFCLLALACYRVVLRSDDMFVRVATAGVMTWILVQAIINIGSVIGLLPVIGVPLPLVSYGGSALVTTLAALGMVIGFARNEPAARRALAARPKVVRRSLAVLSGSRPGGRR